MVKLLIKENQRAFNILKILIDGILVGLSLRLAYYLRFIYEIIPYNTPHLPLIDYMKPLLYIIPLYLLSGFIFGLYQARRSKSVFGELIVIIKASLLCIVIFISVLYITKNVHYSRHVIALFGVINFVLFTLQRCVMRSLLKRIRRKGYNQKNVLIIGYSPSTKAYIEHIKNNPTWGYHIVGILDDTKKKGYTYSGIKVIGTLKHFEQIAHDTLLDEVIITLKIEDYPMMEDIIYRCEKSGVFTRIIPDYFKFLTRNPHLELLDGLPIISIREVPLHNIIKRFTKRSVDIIGSLVALILFSPVMLSIAAGIKLSSAGPLLFKQERVGLNKKNFNMLKFRSMVVQNGKDSDIKWTTSNDPRVTKIGSFIRKTSIDELPQLFNVLKGDMSLIGPRPERPFYVDKFKEEIPKYMVKHQVRPGITGWAQVNGWRGDTSIEKRIECDIYYIENWSLLMDVKILFMTVFKGFVNDHAY